MLTVDGMVSVFIYGLKERIMNTKDFLKTELDKIDKNAYYEIEGYGNVEFICKVMELYADVVNKNCNIPRVMESDCDHEWLNHSFDHFGFLQEQICDKCGAKQSVP
jgi:hypothetical protein